MQIFMLLNNPLISEKLVYNYCIISEKTQQRRKWKKHQPILKKKNTTAL